MKDIKEERLDLDRVIILRGDINAESAEQLARAEQKTVFFLPEGADILDTEIIKKEFDRIYAQAREETLDKLSGYIEHYDSCILSHCTQGRPTENGGYENMFDGKWYQSRPVDNTPKCNCGLQEILLKLSTT